MSLVKKHLDVLTTLLREKKISCASLKANHAISILVIFKISCNSKVHIIRIRKNEWLNKLLGRMTMTTSMESYPRVYIGIFLFSPLMGFIVLVKVNTKSISQRRLSKKILIYSEVM